MNVHLDPETKLKPNSMTSAAARVTLFGEPPLLAGEDAAAYDEFLARIRAVVNPVDVIDEMFIADVASLEWEVLRWRRLKWTLMQATGLEALRRFLVKQLEWNYTLHEEYFKTYLTEILRDNLPADQADSAEMLAAECTPNDADSDAKLDKVLSSIGKNTHSVLVGARACHAEELLQEYVRREPDAVSLINELLTVAGMSMDDFMADALAKKLDEIERIDRLATIAESRRNSSLREIDRRRAVLGETLRRGVQEIEEGEFKVIETTPAKGKDAA
jgi:hypothetical protein